MNILKKFFAKENIYNHITLLSIIGIFTISAVNISSYAKSYSYTDIIYFVPISYNALIVNQILFFLTGFALCGFSFQLVNAYKEDDFKLPEISLDSIKTFFKIFPLIFVWILYFSFVQYYLQKVIGAWAGILLLCLFPFANLIWIMYAKSFQMKSQYFNPKLLFSVMNKTLIEVVKLVFYTFLLFLFAGVISWLFFIMAEKSYNQICRLILKLAGIYFGTYFLFITNFFYNLGLSEIEKNKLSLN